MKCKGRLVAVIASLLLPACHGTAPELGVRGSSLSPCPDTPNCVSSDATDRRHFVEPLPVAGEPGDAFAQLAELIAARNDAVIVERTEDYLRVEFHTTFFTDDAEFYLDAGQRRIHVRSASRVGYSDLGKNRERVEQLRKALLRTDGPETAR